MISSNFPFLTVVVVSRSLLTSFFLQVEGFYKIYTANYKGSDMLARALSITHKKNYIDNPSNFQKLKDMYKVFDSISKVKTFKKGSSFSFSVKT